MILYIYSNNNNTHTHTLLILEYSHLPFSYFRNHTVPIFMSYYVDSCGQSMTMWIFNPSLFFFSFPAQNFTDSLYHFLGFPPLGQLLEAPKRQKINEKKFSRCNFSTVMLKVIIILSPWRLAQNSIGILWHHKEANFILSYFILYPLGNHAMWHKLINTGPPLMMELEIIILSVKNMESNWKWIIYHSFLHTGWCWQFSSVKPTT